MTFGKRLQMAMEMLGISQIELSRRTGIDQSQINHFAQDRREPSLKNFVRICDALKINPEMMLPREDTRND